MGANLLIATLPLRLAAQADLLVASQPFRFLPPPRLRFARLWLGVRPLTRLVAPVQKPCLHAFADLRLAPRARQFLSRMRFVAAPRALGPAAAARRLLGLRAFGLGALARLLLALEPLRLDAQTRFLVAPPKLGLLAQARCLLALQAVG
ncbi:MAG: hypothetical protein ABR970_07120, partial [Roseiarcus sp.]